MLKASEIVDVESRNRTILMVVIISNRLTFEKNDNMFFNKPDPYLKILIEPFNQHLESEDCYLVMSNVQDQDSSILLT